MKSRLLYLVICFLVFPLQSIASEEDSSFSYTGSLRFGAWTSSRTLDNQANIGVPSIWLKSKYEFSENTKIVVDGWIRKEGATNTSPSRGSLREAYLQTNWGDWEFSVGRRLFLWGRADGINPTDQISPRNFTLLVPEDSEQRLGAYSASAKYFWKDHSFQFISLPYFVGNTVPIPEQGYPLSNRIQYPSGVQNHFALKWEKSGGEVDYSVSYYQGYDLSPDLGIRRVPRIFTNETQVAIWELSPSYQLNHAKVLEANSLQTTANHYRIHMYGADVSKVIGKYSLRGETAYIHTADPNGKDLFIKNSNWQSVLGGDRTFLEYLNVNIQYIYKRTFFVQNTDQILDPYERSIARVSQVISNQLFEHLHGFSLRLSYKWFHETLEGEVSYVRYVTSGDYLVRPKLKYAISDQFYWILGGEHYSGSDQTSFFGLLRRNSGVFTEIQYFF
ncbi:hypothetical protein LPTSP4_29940 [Leptospira ryugenii]|uniref:Uncharacterized protein n=1 Tax=Leptospira ryugenii TaxID=1917863 RepID=A0A2P2E3K7_9LEPT|nr:hypothetical protein [Leptospira ryugenii]GBF51457.1 hypothetical protein LPTSP4_29940 [Leptospira ryugenii]